MQDRQKLYEIYKDLEATGFSRRIRNRFALLVLITIALFTLKFTIAFYIFVFITSAFFIPFVSTFILQHHFKDWE